MCECIGYVWVCVVFGYEAVKVVSKRVVTRLQMIDTQGMTDY